MAKKKSEIKRVRFFRGLNPTIVWDIRNNCQLCDFSEGHLTTSDEFTIEHLRRLGYTEIPLDASHPPEIPQGEIQPADTPDVKVGKATEEEALATPVEAEDEHGPAVPAPKKKTAPSKKPVAKKTSPKKSPAKTRAIKRRAK